MTQQYITVEQARQDLGDKDFHKFLKWLREKGFDNLTQVGEASFKHEIFATKDQLNMFLREKVGASNGNAPIVKLYGQTREFLSKRKLNKRKS